MNIHVRIPEFLFLSLLGICLGMELLDQMVILCLIFEELPNFSIAAIQFYISTSNVREFQFLHIFINICYFLFFFFR